MKFKSAKLVVRIGNWVRSCRKMIHGETKFSVDPEHLPFIRGKRRKSHLPNTWDTQWIPKFKSWKDRSKVKHQWEKHEKSKEELNKYYNYSWDKDQLLFRLKNYKGDWYYLCDESLDGYFTALDRVFAAEELERDGLVEVLRDYKRWKFYDMNGKVIIHQSKKKEILAIRLKSKDGD